MLLSEQFYQTEKQDTWTNNSDFFTLRPDQKGILLPLSWFSQGVIFISGKAAYHIWKSLSTETMGHSSGKPPSKDRLRLIHLFHMNVYPLIQNDIPQELLKCFPRKQMTEAIICTFESICFRKDEDILFEELEILQNPMNMKRNQLTVTFSSVYGLSEPYLLESSTFFADYIKSYNLEDLSAERFLL